MLISITKKVRLFLMGMLIFSTNIGGAEVLAPPAKIPFAKDVIIKKYAKGKVINQFRYKGKWEIKEINNCLSIVGTAYESSAVLISIDKLSKEPKTFKLDYIVNDLDKTYGFIYDNIGVLVENSKMYPAVYDEEQNRLEPTAIQGKIIKHVEDEYINTLDITTGNDPIGGSEQVCNIYINGVGVTLNCPNDDGHFGIYIGPQNGLTINNIRWGIGSK